MSATIIALTRHAIAGALGARRRSPATLLARAARRRDGRAAARARAAASRIAPPAARGYALTFDDGPHPQGTPAVLEMLARERVRATFFLVGEQVLRNPALAREIADAGHGIALHCHRHRNLLRLTPRQVREDIARAEDAIAAHTGCSPTLYRPPYGVLNAAALRARARARLAHAAVEPLGPRLGGARHPRRRSPRASPTAPARARCCCCTTPTTTRRPDSWRRTAAALPRVLETLAERGLAPGALTTPLSRPAQRRQLATRG